MDNIKQQFFSALQEGNVTKADRLLTVEPSLLYAINSAGVSAVLAALYSGKRLVADLILSKRPTLDVYAAAAYAVLERLRDLLDAKPSLLNSHSEDGWTPLHLACFFGREDAAGFLLSRGADVGIRSTNSLHNQPLHAAVAGKCASMVPILLAAGADVNAAQHGGYAPIHGAAANGDLECLRLLLAHGADPALRTDRGDTPLDIAVARGHTEVAALLRAWLATPPGQPQ